MKYIFISIGSTGVGISGGDRIYIELARQWSKEHTVTIVTTVEGIRMCNTQKLSGRKMSFDNISKKLPSPFLLKYLYKIFLGIKYGFTKDIKNPEKIIVYSSSEFWMDVFPAVILKLRYPKVRWIATWYQTAPNPLRGFSEIKREKSYNFAALLYWLVQMPVIPFIKRYANWVIVNNEDEKRRYPELSKQNKLFVLIGAVRAAEIENYLQKNKKDIKIYDSVFQGRFHPQKGVVELVRIWSMVVQELPNAILAMIGDGPLMSDVKQAIKKYNLEKNIELFGYVFDGDKKYKIFSQSKIVVHPSFYDSGGMATAEAMAFGTPAVGFNLKAYESYYKKGMEKVASEEEFAQKIVYLLNNSTKRNALGKIAKNYVKSEFSWENRAKELYRFIKPL